MSAGRAALALLALVLHGGTLAAQTTRVDDDTAAVLVGTVRSWLGGRPIGNAYISLESVRSSTGSRSTGVQSDSTGQFVLRSPVGGEYLLLARAMSVEAGGKVRMPVHLGVGDTVRIDLFLPPYDFDPARRQAQLDELAQAHDRWREHGPDAYRASVTWECFCLGLGVGEWMLQVKPETTLVLRRPKDGGDRPPVANIEALFEWLEKEMRDPRRRVEVRYDNRLGYPTDIDTDTVSFLTDMWTKVVVRGVKSDH